MFQPVPRQLFMVDPDRGYSWRDVGTTEKGEVEISAVTIDGREIPYEFRVFPHKINQGWWYDIQIGVFGYSPIGAIKWGTGRVDWVSVEATLAWLPAGLGVERGDGYNRSTFKGV